MTDVVIRPAQRKEAADLAILDNIAGHGISQWFWQKAVSRGEAKDALDWGRNRFASDEIFAWRNSFVAVQNEMIAGSVTSYLMPDSSDEDLEDLKKGAVPFIPVFELNHLAKGQWFVDVLSVFEAHQGQGIGRALLENSIARAKESGAEKTMLVSEDTNSAAMNLYTKLGFKQVASRPFVDFGLNHVVNEWLLLAVDN